MGFDGSSHMGRSQIESDLTNLFSRHVPATYIGIVRTIRFLAPDVAVLRAVAGMVPPGQQDIHPSVNAVQTLVAGRRTRSGASPLPEHASRVPWPPGVDPATDRGAA